MLSVSSTEMYVVMPPTPERSPFPPTGHWTPDAQKCSWIVLKNLWYLAASCRVVEIALLPAAGAPSSLLIAADRAGNISMSSSTGGSICWLRNICSARRRITSLAACADDLAPGRFAEAITLWLASSSDGVGLTASGV